MLRLMAETTDEHFLAEKLCGELLTATDLRQLCQLRGFPIVDSGKDALARSVAARLLDTRGVGKVMAQLEPTWLRLLHLAKAVGAPIGMNEMAAIAEPDVESIWAIDYRAFFRKIAANLLAKGVALVTENPNAARSDSRYARFQLILPATFQAELPPYPIVSEAIGRSSKQGGAAFDDLLEAALRGFMDRYSRHGQEKPSTLIERVAAELGLDDGMLRFRALQHPTGERVACAVRDVWTRSLVSRGQHKRREPGAIVAHILANLAPGTGCTSAQLAKELELLGCPAEAETVIAFCEEGVAAGFLWRSDRAGAESLYRAADVLPLPKRTKLDLASESKGGCAAAVTSAFLALLEVAAVARVIVDEGKLKLEPDPIQMGRRWHELSIESRAQLRSVSKAFDRVAQHIEEREGQVIVHRGLGVLRVEDSGLRALLCQRFSAKVRALDREYLACQLGVLTELVAFAKKEGFVTRRAP